MEKISKEKINNLEENILEVISRFDIENLQKEKRELEERTLDMNFWSNNLEASKIMSELEDINERLSIIETLKTGISTLQELFDISEDTDLEELSKEYENLSKIYKDFRKYEFLSGKYDRHSSIFSIHAGQGGTEAQDWAEMLLRMYMKFFDKKGWKYEITDMIKSNEAGLSTVTLIVEGKYSFGLLKNERGTHRLVRISPFNAQNLRQTSFAGVEVLPLIEDSDDDKIIIPDSEIEFKAVRSGGPGGQGVNTTSSAVQIKHIPTGITVHCSERRSQLQNRESAMKILKSKLWEIKEEKKEKEMNKIKGEYKVAGWGNQIRNYILHPYKLVKDLRTGLESTNPDDILEGNLDEFIEAGVHLNKN